MAFFQLHNVSVYDDSKFRKKSRQLDELLKGDFRSVKAELRDAFPNTSGLQERYLPLVSRFAHEMTAGLYTRPVLRKFKRKGIDKAVYQKLSTVYQKSKVDRFLLDVHRSLLCQGTVLIAVLPAGPDRVKLLSFNPWQFYVEPSSPMFADDLAMAKEVKVSVPISSDSWGSVVYGTMCLSNDYAYIEQGGAQVPAFGDSVVNPLGRIPLVAVRMQAPLPGRFECPLNESLLSYAIGLMVSESDTELLVHHQAWGQKVMKNAQMGSMAEELQVGPDRILHLYNMDPQTPGPELQIVQGNPPLAQITGWTESRLRLMCSMFDLAPDAFLKVNTAVTASARAADARDRKEGIDRVKPILVQAEQELASLIADVLNMSGAVQIPSDGLTVDINYSTYDPPVDPLHDAQAMMLQAQMGLVSPVQVVMDRDGLTRQQAIDKIKLNLSELRELGLAQQPGTEPSKAIEQSDD
tara:strand:- start:643 stop:2037 length:1395 start_codon:yes stop_codon:yes gene_type:complete